MAVGDFDPPGVTDRAKDLRTMFVARWLVPTNPADLAAEPGGEPLGRRLRGSPVHEHEFEAPVSARAGQVLEYQLDGARLGGRGGHDAHAERKAGDVDADDSFCPVSPAIGTALVVESHAPIGGPSREVGVDDDHRGRGSFRPRAVRDEACNGVSIRDHVPLLDHRRNCDQTLVQGPNSSGRYLH